MSSDPTALSTGYIPVPTPFPTDESESYNPFPSYVAPYIGAVFMETFLYGIYTILFTICIYILITRRKKALHSVLFTFAVLMYSLATADISYTYYLFFGKLLKGTITFNSLYPKYVMFVTNTLLADCLLLYRCYVVWGGKKRVVIGPALLLVATTVCGYLFEGASISLFEHAWVYLAMTFALNMILTGLTAGRIWYLAHRAGSIIGKGLLKRYNASVAILIESGSIYSVYMLLDLAFHTHPSASAVLDAGLIQIVGIVPTLIIVQVGLGREVHNVEDDDAFARVETNKANSRSFSVSMDGGRSVHTTIPHDARSLREASLRSPTRSHRGSNASISRELAEHRKSFRSTRSQHRDRTMYDLRLSTGTGASEDTYMIPSSPRSLPPSPVLVKPEMSFNRSIDGKIYQPFFGPHTVALELVETRDSGRTVRSGDLRYEASAI